MQDDDIDRACDEWLSWATQADLGSGLATLLNKDANDKGDFPLRHLAALAATGDVNTLQAYCDAFACGDRLGFVPYINADYMTAARDFAQQRSVVPDWLPRSPKLRV